MHDIVALGMRVRGEEWRAAQDALDGAAEAVGGGAPEKRARARGEAGAPRRTHGGGGWTTRRARLRAQRGRMGTGMGAQRRDARVCVMCNPNRSCALFSPPSHSNLLALCCSRGAVRPRAAGTGKNCGTRAARERAGLRRTDWRFLAAFWSCLRGDRERSQRALQPGPRQRVAASIETRRDRA